jgi:hypothetical protein
VARKTHILTHAHRLERLTADTDGFCTREPASPSIGNFTTPTGLAQRLGVWECGHPSWGEYLTTLIAVTRWH